MQIRTKLSLSFIGITTLILIFSLVFIYLNFRNHLYTEFYKDLDSKAHMTVSMVADQHLEPKSEEIYPKDDVFKLPSKENIIIFSTRFEKLFAFHNSHKITDAVLEKIANVGDIKFRIGSEDAIGLKCNTNTGKEVIVVATGLFMSDELIRLRNILIFNFLLCIIVVTVIGYYLSGQALRPLVDTMNELDSILPTDLGKRINTGKNNDEISRLAISFNKLLDRNEDAFNVQKGFMSNISHELRNPLTSIITRIQVILGRERGEKEYKQCLESVLHDAIELDHTSSHLLQLARLSVDSEKILFVPLRLDDIIWQSKAQVKNNNPQYNFKLATSEFPSNAEQFEITANEALLKTAFVNIMENACKFSPDHMAYIKFHISAQGETVVEIRDTAPIIDKAEIENIFKPFYRSTATSNIHGTGIGLSLVATILKIHHARLTVTSYEGKGNIFSVFFGMENELIYKK